MADKDKQYKYRQEIQQVRLGALSTYKGFENRRRQQVLGAFNWCRYVWLWCDGLDVYGSSGLLDE